MHGRKLITTGTVAALAILAVVGGCREATTGPTSVNPQDFASALKLLTGNQQVGAVGAPLPELLSVKVVDAGGQAVPGATVLWQVRDGGGTVSPAASTSSVSGLATVSWTLGTTLGSNKVVAILQGNYTLDSAIFIATAQTGPAQKFSLTAGNLQTGRVTNRLPTPLSVNVKDQYGYPIVGAKVTWAPGDIFSGTVTAVSDSTDATGTASANWTLGQYAITQTATATVAGLTPITFNATATADTGRRIILVSGGTPAPATVGSAMPAVTVKVTDQWGNPVASAPIVWGDSLTGGAKPTSASGTTATDGTASTTWRLGNRPGTQLMRIKETTGNSTVTVTGTATIAFTDAVAGNFHVCARSTGNLVYCWGLNDVGQLGKGNNLSTSAPSTAVALTADSSSFASVIVARQLTGSRSSVCAVTLGQDVYCWGHQWGSLATSPLPALAVIKAGGGTGAPLALNYLQVSEDHGCLIQVSGVSNCTGNNDQGQLGDNEASAPPFASPSASTWPYVDKLKPYSMIALGTSFSCGFHRLNTEAAPDSSQIPLCWGDGSAGQRGDAVTTNFGADSASKPKHIKVTSLAAGIKFDSLSLAVGDKHACVIVAATSPAGTPGDAYCWGLNAQGQLGRVTPGVGNANRDSVAALVQGGHAFVRLFAGKYHTCGLEATGTAWCWGRNDYGQLGDGNRMAFNTGTWTPVQVGGGVSFRSLTLGELFTCGVAGSPSTDYVGASSQAGRLYCWGDNSFGQTGNGVASGGSAPVLTPTPVLYQP
jgi:alpha-tubulin suppressor-like RCC1 family protein